MGFCGSETATEAPPLILDIVQSKRCSEREESQAKNCVSRHFCHTPHVVLLVSHQIDSSLLLWMQMCALPSLVGGVREMESEEEDVMTDVVLFTFFRLFINLFM